MSLRSKLVAGTALVFAGLGLGLAPSAAAATAAPSVITLPPIVRFPIHCGPIIVRPLAATPAMVMCPL